MESLTVTMTANYLATLICCSAVTLDLSYDETLAADPAQLVNHLNSLLMAGNMSSTMQSTVINAITQIPAKSARGRVNNAIYLILNSPEFVVDK